jgi:hypothetical protein
VPTANRLTRWSCACRSVAFVGPSKRRRRSWRVTGGRQTARGPSARAHSCVSLSVLARAIARARRSANVSPTGASNVASASSIAERTPAGEVGLNQPETRAWASGERTQLFCEGIESSKKLDVLRDSAEAVVDVDRNGVNLPTTSASLRLASMKTISPSPGERTTAACARSVLPTSAARAVRPGQATAAQAHPPASPKGHRRAAARRMKPTAQGPAYTAGRPPTGTPRRHDHLQHRLVTHQRAAVEARDRLRDRRGARARAHLASVA